MTFKKTLRSLLPAPLLSAYHFMLAYLGALRYGFPSDRLTVIGVTGTNGKSSTIEFITAIFEAAGYATALSSSIRVKVGNTSRSATGRSMPGRSFIQRFFRDALSAGCTVAIIEMTSEGAKQHRHRGIALDALVFLNLAPEHIEAHGSYQAYADAKFELGRALARSSKRPRIMVANADDEQGARYLALPVEKTVGFTLADRKWTAGEHAGTFMYDHTEITVAVPGACYVNNALAAAELAHAFGIDSEHIKQGIERVLAIPGRMQPIAEGQRFEVFIDYALTPDALDMLYRSFAEKYKIAVFGSAGGGRDTWKRPVLGEVADTLCDTIILTNDIAYDEPPARIIQDIATGIKRHAPEIVPDRRRAMRRAFEIAHARPDQDHAVVLITGMGIDSELTAADGSTIAWNEEQVAREELRALLRNG